MIIIILAIVIITFGWGGGLSICWSLPLFPLFFLLFFWGGVKCGWSTCWNLSEERQTRMGGQVAFDARSAVARAGELVVDAGTGREPA